MAYGDFKYLNIWQEEQLQRSVLRDKHLTEPGLKPTTT